MLLASASLAYSFKGDARRIYLPGPTTSGHYQIELACEACHIETFAGPEAMQEACVRCHGAELKGADDSHPERKFTDPRNADRIAVLDARYCVTCHREHRPEITSSMGLSLPTDYCYRCHESIAEERPTHRGLAFDTCSNAGCHNFHDNRALYEDFLARHLDAPAQSPIPRNPIRSVAPSEGEPRSEQPDAPPGKILAPPELENWERSGHARAGLSCSECHVSTDGTRAWQDKVSTERCGECHENERKGFLESRHGMSEAQGLAATNVAAARLAMRDDAKDRVLGCTSCHGSHGFDTRRAAVDACLECHADSHSTSYRKSRHAELWNEDRSGQSGASCATCHLPRLAKGKAVLVHHNQNDTLRPNEKMARDVCMNCHGLGFTLDALADPALVAVNFRGRPSVRVESFRMVRERLAAQDRKGTGDTR